MWDKISRNSFGSAPLTSTDIEGAKALLMAVMERTVVRKPRNRAETGGDLTAKRQWSNVPVEDSNHSMQGKSIRNWRVVETNRAERSEGTKRRLRSRAKTYGSSPRTSAGQLRRAMTHKH